MLTIVAALILAPKSWVQKLPDGTSVNFIAVSNFGTKKSWNPDGTAQNTWTAPDLIKQFRAGPSSKALNSLANFIVQVAMKDTASMPSVAFKTGNQLLGLSYILRDEKNSKMWWAGAGVDAKKISSTVNLQVGVGTGAWKRVATHDMQAGGGKGAKFFGNILRNVRNGNNSAVVLEATIPKAILGKMAYRIKLYDVNGHALTPAGISPLKPGVPARWFFVENGKRLVRADLITQPYKWLTFRGVHTRPR